MFARRALLILMVLTVPAIATAALYVISVWGIHEMGRIVADPRTLQYLTIGEFVLFTFGALLEARSRWSLPSTN